MPRIDPNQLLKCLGALLGANGGIKSTQEVKRIATLMSKFSKKLVSKCIYIQILKSTQSDLLVQFMAEGGWALVFQWLHDAMLTNNYALIREILELLLVCPISLDRLKENNCPKVVKGLSKDSEDEQVKILAGKLVEQWLKFIKSGQAAISDVAAAAAAAASATVTASPSPRPSIVVPSPSNEVVMSSTSNIAINPSEVAKKVTTARKIPKSAVIVQESSSDEDEEIPPIGSLPLYKITVKDGKSVLAKVGTKTLSVTKKVDSDIETNTASSLVLKTDPISKRIRYMPKTVTDKEKSDASDTLSDDSLNRDKSDLPNVVESKLPESAASENRENKLIDDETDSSDPGKIKLADKKKSDTTKTIKEGKDLKSRTSESKSSKLHKERDKHKEKSDSGNKEKDKKESDKDRKKSDHRSSKSEKDRDRDRDSNRDKDKEKSKHKDSSKDRHKDHDKHKSKDKESKSKDSKSSEKNLSAAEKAQIQADKDKDTLERLKTPAISQLGKIPKKTPSLNTSQTSKISSPTSKQSDSDSRKTGNDTKKPESRGPKDRPITVKTFNSKFRSTGLEEEIKPPPPRNSIKKKVEEKRTVSRPLDFPGKHPSSSPKDGSPPEKKSKVAEIMAEKKDKIVDKPGGIKLIPPKPKPTLLESDMFSDALIASAKLEPRKRKRRPSNAKEGPDVKKEIKEESGMSPPASSPKDVKPVLKFYRDTLKDDDKNKENEDVKTEKAESDSEDSSKLQSSDGDGTPKLYPNGVLIHKARKGTKKSVKWKVESELIDIKYFELDETERVNVTRNFVDMKIMERSHEREAFQMARKLSPDDVMEEKVPWGPLQLIDLPPPSVEPGNASQEKNVQCAREKTILQAIYFHRNSIPDSPSEPDAEIHPISEPKIIPLEDITGNADSVSNFTHIPWPEPKPSMVPSSPSAQQAAQQQMPMQNAAGFAPGYSTVGNFIGYPQMGMPGVMPPGQSTWRTGDGKDMQMNMNFQNGPPMCPQMGQPPNMFNPTPDGFNMNVPPMGGFNPGFGMGCDPSMYRPPMGGPPPPGWNRGGGWQGPRGPPMNMPPKYPKGVCHQFAKYGSCSRGNTCRFMHPGVNCPPLS